MNYRTIKSRVPKHLPVRRWVLRHSQRMTKALLSCICLASTTACSSMKIKSLGLIAFTYLMIPKSQAAVVGRAKVVRAIDPDLLGWTRKNNRFSIAMPIKFEGHNACMVNAFPLFCCACYARAILSHPTSKINIERLVYHITTLTRISISRLL